MKREIKLRKIGCMVFVLLIVCSSQVFAACGDVNSSGDIDIVDALLIAQFYVGLNPANFDSTVADVDGDMGIDIVDALLIAQFYVGLIYQLSCPSDTPAPTPTTPTPGGGMYQCTCVIGYSQVQQWYNAGFENIVDNARWQLLWNGGAGVDQWQNPSYSGWNSAVQSSCASGANSPDRVVLSISGPYGEDESAWASAIEGTITNIRNKYPGAASIVLMPVVGGPGHQDCTNGGQLVRASWQHRYIDAAIAMVVGGDVVAGASPEVGDCSHYSDSLGHLTSQGAQAAAQQIGTFYLTF